MARRHHSSKMHHGKHHMSGHSPVFHEKDHFNDEMKHDSKPERFGSYHYDRQSEYRVAQGAEHYAGAEPRRRQEMMDAGMIHEDHRAIANLPQGVMIKPYPAGRDYLPEGLDDTLRGVDQQMNMDDSQRSKHFFPKKV